MNVDATVATLQARLAEAHRAAHANAQRVLELEAELSRTAPVAAAAHAYCADPSELSRYQALLAAHRATTPSPTPPTHTVVAVAELERLRAAAGELGADGPGWAEDDARNAEMGL
jgi:hypothetical protein